MHTQSTSFSRMKLTAWCVAALLAAPVAMAAGAGSSSQRQFRHRSALPGRCCPLQYWSNEPGQNDLPARGRGRPRRSQTPPLVQQ